MTKAIITKTSSDSAVVEPIVLRPGVTTRLVFKPQIVNNKRDESRPVRGELLWQRRGAKERDADWVDEASLRLSSLTSGSGIKLALDTQELYILTQVVRGLYGVYWNNGKRLPNTGEVFELADYAQAAKTLDTLDSVAQVMRATGEEGFVSVMKWLATKANSAKVLDALSKLGVLELAEINSLAGIGILRQALDEWKANKANADEGFWQATLTRYSFLFSQLFSSPVVVFGEKYYVGGKTLENKGGKQPDIMLANALTSHVLIVEIKTPETQLLNRKPYREPDVFSVTSDVSGALVQTARYKEEFIRNYSDLFRTSKDKFLLADPQCLIVIGNTAQLDTVAKKDSFEYFRRGQKGIDLITFDELFRKVDVLLTLLQSGVTSITKG